MDMIETVCIGCGLVFAQPVDPGRRREYHDGACRSRAWRARQAQRPDPSTEWQLGWAEHKSRQYRQKVHDLKRKKQQPPAIDTQLWMEPQPGDTGERRRKRRVLKDVWRAPSVGLCGPGEAELVVRQLRRLYGL